MPLYEHKLGERKRTVPGSYEDRRVAGNPDWKLIPKATAAAEPAAAPAPGPKTRG
jgi:hypothetical protein